MLWRRITKWTLITFTGLILLLLVGLVSGYFVLKSGELTQQAVPTLAPYLAPLGIELQELESANIDLLRSVQLRNVRLIWRDSQLGEIQFIAERFQATYDLPALLSNRLEVNQVILENAHISAHLRSSPGVEPTTGEPPMSLEQLSEQLRSPPMPFLAKAININNLKLDLLVEIDDGTQQQSINYKGVLQEAAVEAIWQANQLKGNLRTTLGQNGESALLVTQTLQDRTLELELAPAISTQSAWELKNEGGKWNLINATVEHHVKVQPLAVYQRTQEERRQVGSLSAAQLDMTGHVNSVSQITNTQNVSNELKNDLRSIFPVAVSTSLSTTLKDLKLEGVTLEDTQISTQADQRMQFSLDGEVDPVQRVFKDFHMQADQSLTVADLDARIAGQRAVVKDLALQFNAQGDASGDAQTTLPLDFVVNVDGRAQQIALQQEPVLGGEQALRVSLRPDFKLSSTGQLQPFADVLQALTINFQPELTAQDVAVRVGNGDSQQEYLVARQQFTSTGKYEDGVLRVDSDVNLERVSVAKDAKRFSLKNHFKFTSDAQLTHSKITVETALDQQPILALELDADNRQQQLNVQQTLRVNLPEGLHAYHPAAEGLRLIGHSRINGSATMQLKHGAESVLAADFTAVDQWPIAVNGEFTVTQLSPPKVENGVTMEQPATVNYNLKKDEQYRLTLQAKTPGILVSPLQAAVPLQVGLQSRFTWPLTTTTASGQIDVQGEKAVQFDLNMNDQPRLARLDSHWSVNMDPQWQQYMAELKELELIGPLASDWHLAADVKHSHNSITEFDPESLDKVKAAINLATEVKQRQAGPETIIQLLKPVKLTQQLDWSTAGIAWQSQFSVPAAQLPQQAIVQDLSGQLRLDASPGESPTQASLSLYLDESNLQLIQDGNAENGLQMGRLVTPLHLQISGAMGDEKIIMSDIILNIANDLITLASTGSTSLDGQSAQLESSVNVALRPKLLAQPAVSGSGTVKIPRLLTIKEGDQVTVDGELQFSDLAMAVDEFQVRGLNGSLGLNEELLLTAEQQVKFRYLVQADPFQRVDFTRIQPYLDNPSLRIQNIIIGDKSLGPALASISLKQNLLRLPRFDLDLFGGHLSGQFYFDASPGAWKIALLGRLSQLDPRQMLPDNAASKASELSPVSARVAVEFDLNQRLLEGRIDMTEISREQLLQLLDVIDPEHLDEQLAQVRTALRLAYPKSVSLDMGQGLMDMTVAISTLPKPIKVYGLPLTPLIQHFGGDTLDELSDLPLQ